MLVPIETVKRPWGAFKLLDRGSRNGVEYWIKELHIEGLQGISIQRHIHRTESWLILAGEGQVWYDLEGNATQILSVGEGLVIPKQKMHGIKNLSPIAPLVILETAVGEHVDEGDIIRYSSRWYVH